MNAREFTNQLEELINHPAQKLVGNITTGYVRLNDEDVRERCIMSSVFNTLSEKQKNVVYAIIGQILKEGEGSDKIQKVIFNPPATIVLWNDGTKTVVKTQNGEVFDPEKGLAMAISKKALGNKGNYFEQIKKWTEPYKEEKAEVENIIIKILSGLTKNE